MYRVTTPTHTFIIPFSTDHIDKLILTYKQSGGVLIEKTEQDVKLCGKTISVTFTQEETKQFNPEPVRIQMRVKIGDKVIASNVIKTDVKNVLNSEVI